MDILNFLKEKQWIPQNCFLKKSWPGRTSRPSSRGPSRRWRSGVAAMYREKKYTSRVIFCSNTHVLCSIRSYTLMRGNERGFLLLLFFHRNLEEGRGGAHVGETRLGQVFRERGRALALGGSSRLDPRPPLLYPPPQEVTTFCLQAFFFWRPLFWKIPTADRKSPLLSHTKINLFLPIYGTIYYFLYQCQSRGQNIAGGQYRECRKSPRRPRRDIERPGGREEVVEGKGGGGDTRPTWASPPQKNKNRLCSKTCGGDKVKKKSRKEHLLVIWKIWFTVSKRVTTDYSIWILPQREL